MKLFSALRVLRFKRLSDDSERLGFCAQKFFSETHKVTRSYQGAAAYGKYLFQFSDHFENVGVYDLTEKKLLAVASFEMNELYHCNNAGFGSCFYREGDEFPLLYVSMENIDAHCALVYRVQKTKDDFIFTHVQTVVYPDPRKDGVYYPNCVLDAENNLLYVMGYTQNTYHKDKNNFIRVLKFPLPNINEERVELSALDALDVFEVESFTATQGATVHKGVIFQAYGFDGGSYLKVLDPMTRSFTASVRLPKHGFPSEPECLVFYNGNFYCADVTGAVYRFSMDLKKLL